MPVSEKTLLEMRVGAEALAHFAGANGIDEAYMAAMQRTAVRAAWLRDMEKLGRVRIERQARFRSNDKTLSSRTVVWVGDNEFSDPSADLTGAWPSEVICAQIALALGANEDGKWKARDDDSLQV